MRRRVVAWWCPECGTPQYVYDTPCKCGQDFAPTWKCRCGKVVREFNCDCGFDRSMYSRNLKLERQLLSALPGRSQTVIERLYKFLRYTAYNRHIPEWVVEEAWSHTLTKLVENIGQYDPNKGEFLFWAMRVARNTLSNEARDDVAINDHSGGSLDASFRSDSDDQEFTISEALNLGEEGSLLDQMVEQEGRHDLSLAMREIAIAHLGTYTAYENGMEVEKSVYHACVQAFYKVGGHGWMVEVSDRTGVLPHTISRRKERAAEAWREWREGRI